MSVLDSIVVSIPACHAGDRGSIPRRGDYFLIETSLFYTEMIWKNLEIQNLNIPSEFSCCPDTEKAIKSAKTYAV